MIELVSTAALLGWMGAAAWLDIQTRRLPNALTLSGVAVALALRVFAGPEAIASGVLGAGLALGLALVLFALGAVGGGDGKLLITAGAFLGPERLGVALLAMALAGGVMAVGAMVRAGAVRSTMVNLYATLATRQLERAALASRAGSIPYGVAIAVGAVAGWFLG